MPTTVLSMQQYDNFKERFAHFLPLSTSKCSPRFRTAKESKKALQGLAAGVWISLLVHNRLVSDDVIFKDLGLVIVDEEQRIGVKAKEHLKKIKVGVDCLTLSATPIPRTLYMFAYWGADMSVINTPPQDRIPITKQIVEPSDNGDEKFID